MGEEVVFSIDGKKIKGDSNKSILDIARANDIFIPAICYLSECSPTLACRMCMVEIDGKIQYSCKAKPKDGMKIVSKNSTLEQNREDIMRVYDVNHPLKCGTCDKSGECELQDYTTIVGIGQQNLASQDSYMGIQKWGKRQYDPSLCILCERCVTTCSDKIGESAIKVAKIENPPDINAYKDSVSKEVFSMWSKKTKGIISQIDDSCSECGECVSVCPVGAFIVQDFQYSANAWELSEIPSTCSHCSANCEIIYNTRYTSTTNKEKKIYRVKNDFHFNPICGAGKYGYEFDNKKVSTPEDLSNLVKHFKSIDTIKFSANITNEEALILQKFKEEFGYKLVCDDAYIYSQFMNTYSSITGKNLYSAKLKDISSSDVVITLGSFVKSENPLVKYHINQTLKMNKGVSIYLHPLKDLTMDLMGKNSHQINYKPNYEEEVMILLLSLLADNKSLPNSIASIIDENRSTFISDDSDNKVEIISSNLLKTIGRELSDIEIFNTCKDKENITLVLGDDIYKSKNSQNLAKLTGLLEKYSRVKVLIIPTNNSIGVGLICDLDRDTGDNVLGYNCKGNITISSDDNIDSDFYIPSMVQQEGTLCNVDKRVVPLNVGVNYDGYNLNDIANELGFYSKYTIDYTKELPVSRGFKEIEFDSLKNDYANDGSNNRGYTLNILEVECSDEVTLVNSIKSLKDKSIAYLGNPILQFSQFTSKSRQIKDSAYLFVSQEYLSANNLANGEIISIKIRDLSIKLPLKLDEKLGGMISYIPTYDLSISFKSLFDNDKYINIDISKEV